MLFGPSTDLGWSPPRSTGWLGPPVDVTLWLVEIPALMALSIAGKSHGTVEKETPARVWMKLVEPALSRSSMIRELCDGTFNNDTKPRTQGLSGTPLRVSLLAWQKATLQCHGV